MNKTIRKKPGRKPDRNPGRKSSKKPKKKANMTNKRKNETLIERAIRIRNIWHERGIHGNVAKFSINCMIRAYEQEEEKGVEHSIELIKKLKSIREPK